MKEGDKIVFINEQCEAYNFINGKTYLINEMINNGIVMSLFDNDNKIVYFNSLKLDKFFVPLKEYRKQKLKKLNEKR